MRVLLLFLDGVGIGGADPERNPFLHARLPRLRTLLDDVLPVGDVTTHTARAATLLALDATLGVPGTPQSGTGQTSLFTGENAARLHGRHFGPWVPVALREMLQARSVLARARSAGKRVAFANAYPEELFAERDAGVRLPAFLRAGPPLVALGAEVLTRHTDALRRGDAVASEITNEGWRERLGRTDLPRIGAAEAGASLARIAEAHDLTLFAHYGTDTAGHLQDMRAAVASLELVDAMLDGLFSALDEETLVVIASDHGNIEDVSRGHTLNPALCVVGGAEHERLSRGRSSLIDVAPLVLEALGVY